MSSKYVWRSTCKKSMWKKKINSHKLLHSILNSSKYDGAVFCLFWWKPDRPTCNRNKSSPWWFYFLTQAQVFRREEGGEIHRAVFSEGVSWFSFGCGSLFIDLHSSGIHQRAEQYNYSYIKKCKAVCTAAPENGLLRSKEVQRCLIQIPPSSSKMK